MAGVLEPVGLSFAEEQVYLQLIRSTSMDLVGLRSVLALGEDDVRTALASLESRGMVAQSMADPTRFLPAPPDLAIEVLVHQREEELQRLRLIGRQLAEEFRRTSQARTPTELVEVLIGSDAVAQRADQLVLGVTREVLSVDRPPYRSPSGPAFSEQQIAMSAAGVAFRTIYDRAATEIPGYLDQIFAYQAAGERSVVVERAPFKLDIYDRATALLPLDPVESTIESVVVVHQSPLLDMTILAFEHLWRSGTPFGGSATPGEASDAAPLELRTAKVLALLAAGLKDTAIARQLGVTERSVRRHVESLLKQLDAETRFQAGLQAGRRGWL